MNRRISESGEDICPVCSEGVRIFAVGACDHPVCSKCSTRMRVLCDQMYCAICRADLPKVAFTKQFFKFENLKLEKFKLHQKHKIFFENEATKTTFFEEQEHRCTVCKSRKVLTTFAQLCDHMKKEHSLFPCDICVTHIKLFSSERKFYDRKRLAEHRRKGDSDDKSHKGHPLCEFCDVRYLDNDELARHLRKDHYYCHFCDTDGISNAFYDQYYSLRDHFLQQHYLCEEGDCVSIQFTNAFRFELDLKAHKAAFHSKNLKKAMAKAVRTLDIDFNLAPRGGGSARGRGRRDRGVVSRRDYEEVANQEEGPSDRAGGLGRGKDFKRERRQKVLEEEEMRRAMNASLNSATSNAVNIIDPNLINNSTPPSETASESTSTEDSKYNRRSEDFPTLAGKVPDNNKDSDSESDQKTVHSDSLAKKVARANNFSVQDGGMEDEDFPSLGGFKRQTQPVTSVPNNRGKGRTNNAIPLQNRWNIIDDDFPDLGKGAGGGPLNRPIRKPPSKPQWKQTQPSNQNVKKSSQSWTNNNGASAKGNKKPTSSKGESRNDMQSSEDYPSLSSIGSILSKGISSGSASDALDRYAADGVSTSVQKSNVRLVESKPDSSSTFQTANVRPPTFESSDDFPTLGKRKKVTEDFPSLGNSFPVSQRETNSSGTKPWGPKAKAETVKTDSRSEETTGFIKIKKKNKKKDVKQESTISEESSNYVKSVKSDKSETSMKSMESMVKSFAMLEPVYIEENVRASSASGKLGNGNADDNSSEVQSKTKSKKKKKKSKSAKENQAESTEDYKQIKCDSKSDESRGKQSGVHITENKENSETDAFPSIHDALQENATTCDTTSTKKQRKQFVMSANEDDFPVLGGNRKKPSMQPPGLKKSAASVTPPGFSQKTAAPVPKFNGPPGFSASNPPRPASNIALADIATLISSNNNQKVSSTSYQKVSSTSNQKVTSTSNSKVSSTSNQKDVISKSTEKNVPENDEEYEEVAEHYAINNTTGTNQSEYSDVYEEVNDEEYEFIKPAEFQERNQKLIGDIVEAFGEEIEKFMVFKELSGSFRKGELDALDYYQNCSEVLGAENFDQIFVELLVLLPDIEKQQELLKAHNIYENSQKSANSVVQISGKSKKGWKTSRITSEVSVCHICKQVILNVEKSIHLSDHHLEADFPSLGASQGRGIGGMGSWGIRAK